MLVSEKKKQSKLLLHAQCAENNEMPKAVTVCTDLLVWMPCNSFHIL